MNEWEKAVKAAARIKKQYPPGTRIELVEMGDDPQKIPGGTRGTVIGVDDIGSIMMRWDNGRGLSLIPGEDSFRVLSSEECREETLDRMQDDFIDKVNREVVPKIDWKEYAKAQAVCDYSYAAGILKNLHGAFVEVYGSDPLSQGMGMIQLPALVDANDNNLYPALVCIDTDSSGEHWGTTFITPHGIYDQDGESCSPEEQKFLSSLIPYNYYYTPVYDHDIHIAWDECPKTIRDILLSVNGEELSDSQTFE